MFIGMLFVTIGMISIYDLWGALAMEVPWQVWPIGVIIVGVLFMVRQKGLAGVAIGLLLVLGIFSAGWQCCDDLESREVVRGFELDGARYVDLSLSYGVGDIVLGSSDYDEIIFTANTRDFEDPKIEEEVFEDGEKKVISISRESGAGFGDDENWKIFLGDGVVYDLDLEYGVADVSLDFRGLDIRKVDISQGVSDTRIVFGDYPTKAYVEGGVSDVDFEFAEDSGVVIEVDGGLLDKDFDGFERRDGKYYSEGYVEGGDNIEVRFEGGVTDLRSIFY